MPTKDKDVSAGLPPLPDADWKQRFRRRLNAWFRRHARDLPWRKTRDPYAIWVSEIMLQQTQVVTVVEYYRRFLEAFPTLVKLAAADQQQVLRLWEGLGYYRRARQLHRAAQEIVREHDGRFPTDPAAILQLPGIGRYTAGAIASIAFDARQPILEANTIRLFSRLLAVREDPTRPAVQRLLWDFADAVLPRRQTGLFNQALMELGSEVCRPRDPACDTCPVVGLCPTAQQGLQDQIPAAKRKLQYEQRLEAAVVVRRNGDVLLRRCGPDERWTGLWDFPRFAVTRQRGAALRKQLEQGVLQRTGVAIQAGQQLAVLKHGVTRFRITLLCHEAQWHRGDAHGADLAWVPLDQLPAYPLNVTGRKIGDLLRRPSPDAS
jgi:A/G-specific adenine glycosylase